MKRVVIAFLAAAGAVSPANAAATVTVTASATILEPARVPTDTAVLADARQGDGERFRQVNRAGTAGILQRREWRNWPVVIEFE